MHSYGYENTTFNYNSDLSGDVLIRTVADGVETCISVPGQALIGFIGMWVGRQKMAEIENMSYFELLGLTKEPR